MLARLARLAQVGNVEVAEVVGVAALGVHPAQVETVLLETLEAVEVGVEVVVVLMVVAVKPEVPPVDAKKGLEALVPVDMALVALVGRGAELSLSYAIHWLAQVVEFMLVGKMVLWVSALLALEVVAVAAVVYWCYIEH
jgi:hypothetical protein